MVSILCVSYSDHILFKVECNRYENIIYFCDSYDVNKAFVCYSIIYSF